MIARATISSNEGSSNSVTASSGMYLVYTMFVSYSLIALGGLSERRVSKGLCVGCSLRTLVLLGAYSCVSQAITDVCFFSLSLSLSLSLMMVVLGLFSC